MSVIGKHISCLQTPAFVINQRKFRENCQEMLDRAQASGVSLRGQTKTHKTLEGGILQTGGTKRRIVTSTLVECEMYAQAGFDDILYGFPLLQCHMERVTALTSKLEMFHVMVDSRDMCQLLASVTPPQGKQWSVFLKVTGTMPSYKNIHIKRDFHHRLTVEIREQECGGRMRTPLSTLSNIVMTRTISSSEESMPTVATATQVRWRV